MTVSYRKQVGVFYAEGPPVPIPNTEVKLCRADNTWLETAREDRYSPTLRQRLGSSLTSCCFKRAVFLHQKYYHTAEVHLEVFPVARRAIDKLTRVCQRINFYSERYSFVLSLTTSRVIFLHSSVGRAPDC